MLSASFFQAFIFHIDAIDIFFGFRSARVPLLHIGDFDRHAEQIDEASNHAEAGIPMAPHMTTSPDNFKNALQNDFEWWADYQDELTERFNAWLVQ